MLIAEWPSVARHERMRPDAGRFYSSAENRATARAEHVDEQGDGQADHVEEASLDVRHECGTGLLDGVRPGTPAPLAPCHVGVDGSRLERPEAHGRSPVLRVLAAGVAQRQPR